MHDRRRRLLLLVAGWSVVVLGLSAWGLYARLAEDRRQSLGTSQVRLGGAQDALNLTVRQLSALPLDLAHRPSIESFVATDRSARDPLQQAAVQQTLERFGLDFDVPLVLLLDRTGATLANTNVAVSSGSVPPVNAAQRAYFQEAMRSGTSMQFLRGQVSRVPGLYFGSRILSGGVAVGVAVVKQNISSLNRLLPDTGGAQVFVTDEHGVVVLSNRDTLLEKRVPGLPPRPDDAWLATYQRVPETIAWEQSRPDAAAPATLITRLASVNHVTVSSQLGDSPFRVWVLEPLADETRLRTNAWTGGALVWLVGALLLWLSWRRAQWVNAALRARRDTYELSQALPLTVFRYTRPARGAPRFSFIGRGAEELFGVPPSQFESDPSLAWRMSGGDDKPPTRPHEFLIEKDDGPTWLLADSTARTEADGSTTYNGYWLDITLRRQSQARFAAVFEHAPSSFVFFDPTRGVTHCNPAALAMFGTADPHALLGRNLWFPGLSTDVQADGRPSREVALESLRAHTHTGERVRSKEWRFRRIDGSAFDTEVDVIALEWAGAPEFCAVIQDITARKQLLDATERARAAAEAASHTKSSFLANMSHELRTPMNAIIGMTYLALEDGLPDKQRDYVEKAHSSARNLLQILNDILDVSKIEAGQLALERIDFELEAVVGEMADVLGLKADEKGLEILFSADPGLPRRLVGDPSRLRQVLVNLGGNAIKFTERGEVTVGMQVAQQDTESIELHAWVSDTGVGMSEAEVERLFQPFVQADSSTTRRYGGTGLGLVISRQLVEHMGGRMWVESRPAQGSTFHFTVRLGRSAPRAPARAWLANELRGHRALLADDNRAALDVLGRMLEALGVTVDRADSGEQALALVDAEPGAYTWFLLDWKMPGIDGVECARRILARHPQLEPCILLVTAFAREDAMRASAGVPLAGVLHKPVTPSSLHDCLVQARRREAPEPAAGSRRLETAALPTEVRERLTGARVLLAEDHPLNRELACELLQRAGMQVVVARDGREALDKLASEGPFDGVLMDCQMPVMDGYAATREIRANPQWQDLPVIAVTASALADDRDRALASGMNAHITKPLHVDAMLRTMAQWIRGPGTGGAVAASVTGAASERSPVSSAAIDRAAGLGFCMGNEGLYQRLLAGFRDTESGFVGDVRAALSEQRPADALRRAHDLKGLAGTLGAPALVQAALALQAAIKQSPDAAAGALLELSTVLERVLAEIERLAPRA